MSSFEEFWLHYPHKVAKGAGIKAWEKLKPDADLRKKIQLALQAQKIYRGKMQATGQWLPNWPASGPWLNQMRWLDDIPSLSDDRPENRASTACKCGEIATHTVPGSLCDACWIKACIHKDDWRLVAMREAYKRLGLTRLPDESSAEHRKRLVMEARRNVARIGQG